MINVGIIGGSGYTAGELIRILMYHPKVNIDFVYSTTNAGKPLSVAHHDLMGDIEMNFTDIINPDVNVVFLCLGHGKSISFLQQNAFANHTKIIDLGNDFRLNKDAHFQGKDFIYGLPELNKAEIKKANYIANPGCFATAIQLALLPLAEHNMLNNDVHINATTGSTGAGVGLSETSHFSWRNNNMSHYKAFEHQHLGEISESLVQLQDDFESELLFIPNRGDFPRGIFATLYTLCDDSLEQLVEKYEDFYKNEPFVTVTTTNINLKQVVQTNKCIISLLKKGNRVLITSIIDNLTKGASGQAIQNMNLMFGLEETTGLNLRPSGF
ncbi:N-acetyl-gamma-glutamyl-phosphate reductase [Flavobacterium sp. WLB]|uniref:N-acetyl-gamma-glutamyl-phosphate reductase n=1 Tax=Flavobacterium TaxID=237 RepID=UPI0006ABE12D|nr:MULTISPECIES: N-acetyl-gamma-glutamyl-phosphate reductase [Flavobacterium]KOP38001.1 N-acetyl-gamma-glutamyl-phosphate reductase [Flavobacterium sp. VMW]OWU90671.1 N-acetyl-gamma-glutamyl-phosphate reductase [Flavobacterium sp. NLM]PUU71214.1 N-acetyl-gamma-glutamyl-phosphate reductase [Flavobacterium sp. WLB]UUF12717.1 N-acetyl-gamma-glutamyl-phosphate reductase [Flavobacterium panici]